MSRQTTPGALHPTNPPAVRPPHPVHASAEWQDAAPSAADPGLVGRLQWAAQRIGLWGAASMLALVLPWSAARADVVIGQVAPLSVALFGFAGTSNIGKLLSDGVLEKGGAALVAPYTGGEPLRNPFNPWIFHVRAGYADETEHMVQQVTTLGMKRIAVMYQDDGFGKAGLEGVQKALARRQLELSAAAPYDRNTDNVDAAVQQIMKSDAQAIIMIAVNKPTSAFVKRYREVGGGAQLYNISVVDAAEIVKLAELKNAHGLGISQVVPFPYQPNLPVVREYQTLLKKYAPDEHINYTSFEEFLGAKVLVEGLRRAGPAPTRAKVIKALESLGHYDLGGVSVNYSPDNRVGSRYVEVTVIGRSGRLMK